MSVITPDYTDDIEVIAGVILATETTTKATFDLSTKHGGWLDLSAGRVDDTAFSAGDISFHVSPTWNSGATPHASAGHSRSGAASTAADNVVATSASVGDTELILTSAAGFAAGDVIAIMDSTPSVTRLEFNRVVAVVSNALLLANPLQYAHTSGDADIVTSAADVYEPMWLAGGTIWNVVAWNNHASVSAVVRALGRTLNSSTST